MNVVVVGAGVIGAAIAEELAARGIRVTVLDMRAPGRGASQASAGMLVPYIEAHGESPLRRLGARSFAMYDAFVARVAERSGEPVEHRRAGTLQVALDPNDAGRLQAAHASLDAAGIPNEWLDSSGVRSLEPAVAAEAAGGLHIPGHGYVNVPALVRALVQSARFSGATFVSPVEAVDVEPRAGEVHVRSGDRRDTADAVVVAAGSWSGRVRVKGAAPLPVRPVRGQLLHLRWPPGAERLTRVVWGPGCYVVPWSDGSVLVGATAEDVGFDEHSTVAAVRDLTGAAGALLPVTWRAAVEAIRVGLRPITPDELPLIGPIAGAPGVFAATGHYRNGILLAPLTADLTATLIADGVRDPLLDLVRPDRF
jgi:glycine oxidase